MSVVVFDIDGTIADNKHRQHHLMGDKKDWKAYNATILDDELYWDISDLLVDLSEQGHDIILCTGREKIYEKVTGDWMIKHGLNKHVIDLYMRDKKDYRSDAIVKVELLDKICKDHVWPWLWFDDRQQVVDALRAKGVRVLQVAPGDF